MAYALRGRELTDNKKPGKAELEEFRQYGMLVSEDGEQSVEFLVSWTAKDINLWLCRLLPKPFEWLDAHLSIPDEGSLHWVLLSSERKKYFRLRRTMTTGKELDEAKGSTGQKFTAFSVVVAPRVLVPKSVYRNWDHAIARALTGSADAEDETDIDLDEADFSDKAAGPARPPRTVTGKGKAPA
ncbi:hypothetical protein OG21DRAFT_1490344 [Imleria badia]|nr:hypothetical protein OG21DRAFT_1490344 [Imleria badia]